MDITQLLAFVMQNDASDLHLSPGNPPIVRMDGALKRVKADELSADDIRTMLYSVMTEDQRAQFEDKLELDFAISFGEKARFRVNAFTSRMGASAVFRTIPSDILTMDELGLPQAVRKFPDLEKGIVLVTGGTGSGKTTTLAAMIDHINKTQSKHVLTIEDPVEYYHTPVKALINHREVGEDTYTFSNALASAMREDPDVILVGEMRDFETISLALTAAETGHLVFGTLHSNSAAKTIDRIIDVFPSSDKEMARTMLAGSLQGVISQALMKRASGKGRVGAFEVLVGTNAVRNLIRENQIPQLYSMLQTGKRYGMMTMDDSINSLRDSGAVTEAEAKKALMRMSDESIDSDEGGSQSAQQAPQQQNAGVPDYVDGGGMSDESEEEESYSF